MILSRTSGLPSGVCQLTEHDVRWLGAQYRVQLVVACLGISAETDALGRDLACIQAELLAERIVQLELPFRKERQPQ